MTEPTSDVYELLRESQRHTQDWLGAHKSVWECSEKGRIHIKRLEKTIFGIDAALSQQPEPVAWMHLGHPHLTKQWEGDKPLYTAPPAALIAERDERIKHLVEEIEANAQQAAEIERLRKEAALPILGGLTAPEWKERAEAAEAALAGAKAQALTFANQIYELLAADTPDTINGAYELAKAESERLASEHERP